MTSHANAATLSFAMVLPKRRRWRNPAFPVESTIYTVPNRARSVMTELSQVGTPADSRIVTVPAPALIVGPSASKGERASGAKSKKASVAE